MKNLSIILSLLLFTASGFSQESPRPDNKKEIEKADTSLNTTYKHVRDMLSKKERSDLKEVEQAWIKYRDLHMQFIRKYALKDGEDTAMTTFFRLTRQRMEELGIFENNYLEKPKQFDPVGYTLCQDEPKTENSKSYTRYIKMNYLQLSPGLRIPLDESITSIYKDDTRQEENKYGLEKESVFAEWFLNDEFLHVRWTYTEGGHACGVEDAHLLILIKGNRFIELLRTSETIKANGDMSTRYSGKMDVSLDSSTGRILENRSNTITNIGEQDCRLGVDGMTKVTFNTMTWYELTGEKLVKIKFEDRFVPYGPVKIKSLAEFLFLYHKQKYVPVKGHCTKEESEAMEKALRDINAFTSDTISEPVLLPTDYMNR